MILMFKFTAFDVSKISN